MVEPVVGEALQKMATGTHAILVYASQENKKDVLFSHLRLGVGKAGLVYVASEEGSDSIRSQMEDFGIETARLISEGSLSIQDSDEVYIEDGKVDPPKIMRKFADFAWGYREKGLVGIRASAEMS